MLKQGEVYDRKTTNVDIYFAEKIAKIDLDPEPKTFVECKKHSDWPKWKEAIAAELLSLKGKYLALYAEPLKVYSP